MGFDCVMCGERELWAFESEHQRRVCWNCHRLQGWPETEDMKRHREINAKHASIEKHEHILPGDHLDANGNVTAARGRNVIRDMCRACRGLPFEQAIKCMHPADESPTPWRNPHAHRFKIELIRAILNEDHCIDAIKEDDKN